MIKVFELNWMTKETQKPDEKTTKERKTKQLHSSNSLFSFFSFSVAKSKIIIRPTQQSVNHAQE